MDDREEDPTPGIIGIDQEPTEAQDNGKIFDSSSFTGEPDDGMKKDEPAPAFDNSITSIPTVDDDKTKKPKHSGGNMPWLAILGGVVVVAVVGVFLTIMIYSGKLNDATLATEYDAILLNLNDYTKQYDTNFQQTYLDAIGNGLGSISSGDIQLTNEEYDKASAACLSRFGVQKEDVEFVKTFKTGNELLKTGANISEAKKRIEGVKSAYQNSNSDLSVCREDVVAEIENKYFDVEIGELKIEKDEERSTELFQYVRYDQPVTVKYKGDKHLNSATFSFEVYDKDGVKISQQTVYLTQGADPGDTLSFNVFQSNLSISDNSSNYANSTTKLVGIRGTLKTY